jgi:uncharacterized protein
MDVTSLLLPLGGGALLGGAAAALLLLGGRVAGISGILGGAIAGARERAWRIAFVVGLVLAGAIAAWIAPGSTRSPQHTLFLVMASGVLVGFGTRLGGGCTSGHGVCGIGRLSKRSLVATFVFMGTGALMAAISGAVVGAL